MSTTAPENLESLILPAKLLSDAGDKLSGDILSRRGADLQIAADKVERIDTPCIEILIAAAQLWRKDDQQLLIKDKSAEFKAALETLGIAPTLLEHGAN